ncbi:MAG: alpha/beta hydrolase [Anaerolineae bacterium]|nr:alpha/beta hydrolase [Anaerolineae bacterium]
MIIYKNYDQQALDSQYNNRARVPEFEQIMQQWERDSESLRQRVQFKADTAYGPHPREILDIFPAGRPGAPVQAFIHGGYWRSLEKRLFHFIAESFMSHDMTYVAVNYPLAPQATMDEIVASCRQAIVWVYQNIAQYNGDPHKIYISGHSAGGHLVAMLMATEWPALAADLPLDLIKGGCAISGLFNLIPIQLSYVNEEVRMDEAMTRRNSPVFLSPTCRSPLIVTVGGTESEEYLAQSQELESAWSRQGLPISRLVVPEANHFSILAHLVNPDSPLRQAVLAQMGESPRS